jgi:hypothetical protein
VRRTAIFLASVAVVVVVPATAFAQTTINPLAQQTSPFAPGVPQGQATTSTTTTPTVSTVSTSSSGSSGLSGSSAIVIGIAALVLIAAISLFIWRDARRRAPVRHRAAAATADAGGRPGSKQRQKPRKLSPAERRRRKRGRAR